MILSLVAVTEIFREPQEKKQAVPPEALQVEQQERHLESPPEETQVE